MHLTRRKLLLSFAATTLTIRSVEGQPFASEAEKIKDPATENDLVRFTSPAHSSFLPAGQNTCIDRRGKTLLYSSDRSGGLQVCRMDLSSGESRQITSAKALDPGCVTFLAGDHAFAYFDGESLRVADLNGTRSREICRVRDGYSREGPFSASVDGLFGFFVENGPQGREIRMVDMRRGALSTVVARSEEIRLPQAWPARAALTYLAGGELWLVYYDGQANRRLRSSEPGGSAYLWAPGRKSLFYLTPFIKGKRVTIREFFPDTGEDKLAAKTTQFVAFDCNRDGSVFVGASGSVAAPHILLLVRAVDRELTLCEHRCSKPLDVRPLFSPESQRVFFQSDQHGKMAIYAINVKALVEETQDDKPDGTA